MIFNNKNKTIFLDADSKSLHVDEKINIILSPSLYWVKKITLPLQSVREVKKLLPSIFEDTLPDGDYSYTAYKAKEASEFFIFAYEDKKILDLIDSKNININNVASIHFAQSEYLDEDVAMKVNETQSIYIKDDIVILVPCCWIEEKGPLDISNITLSSHKVNIQQFGHIIDIKNLYALGITLMVLIVLIFSEYFITLSKAQNILESKDELFVKYNLKSTMMQNKSMLKKYKTIHTKQTKLRKSMSEILSMRLTNNEKITLLDIKGNTLIVTFSGVKEKNTSRITSVLKSKNIILKSSYKNDILRLEIQL